MKRFLIISLIAVVLTLLGLLLERPYSYVTGNECSSVQMLDNWCYAVTNAKGYPLSVFPTDTPYAISDLDPEYKNLLINLVFYYGVAFMLVIGGSELNRKFTTTYKR